MRFIRFHSERNIKCSELIPIILKSPNLKESLKKFYPVKNITLTNYGRTALQLILDRYKLKDCKIMIPAFICLLFKDVFKERKIIPILIDVEKDTFNISSRTLKKNFDKSAVCLITNNMNGLPCEVEKLKKILNNDQILIEDCAHSLGAYHNGLSTGTFGDAAFFSLYKNLPTISGGFAITNNPLKKLESERNIFKTGLKMIYYLGKISHFYKLFKNDFQLYGKNLEFKDIPLKKPNFIIEKLAAFYLLKLSFIIKSRQKLAKILEKELKASGVQLQENPLGEHIYTYFSFLLPKKISEKREQFLDILKSKGIIGRLIWDQPFSKLIKGKCPISNEISKRIVSIPINSNNSVKEMKLLSKKILESLKELN